MEKKDPLLDALLAKDRERFYRLLFDRYSKKILAMAGNYASTMDHASRAEDILMEVFLKLMEKGLEMFDPDRFHQLGGLIHQTTKFVVLNNCRRRRVRSTSAISDELIDQQGAEDGDIKRFVFANAYENLMSKLPPLKREVFKLREEGYSHQEIAEELGISEENSRFHSSTARKILLKQINADRDDPTADPVDGHST